MPNPDAGNASRRPFLAALAGLLLFPFFGRPGGTASADSIGAGDGGSPGMELLVGQVILIPYSFMPRGYLECDGREHPISQYNTLYSLLGTRYGGDGRRTFGVPSLKAPRGLRYVIATSGVYPSRS